MSDKDMQAAVDAHFKGIPSYKGVYDAFNRPSASSIGLAIDSVAKPHHRTMANRLYQDLLDRKEEMLGVYQLDAQYELWSDLQKGDAAALSKVADKIMEVMTEEYVVELLRAAFVEKKERHGFRNPVFDYLGQWVMDVLPGLSEGMAERRFNAHSADDFMPDYPKEGE